MREIERIDRILALIRELWLQYPDFRLNQLMSMLLRSSYGKDFFYVEDTFLENKLIDALELNEEAKKENSNR